MDYFTGLFLLWRLLVLEKCKNFPSHFKHSHNLSLLAPLRMWCSPPCQMALPLARFSKSGKSVFQKMEFPENGNSKPSQGALDTMKHVNFTSDAALVSFTHAAGKVRKWSIAALANLAVYGAVFAEENHAGDGDKVREKGVRRAIVALLKGMEAEYSNGYIYGRGEFVTTFLSDEKELVQRLLTAENPVSASELVIAHWAGNPQKFGASGSNAIQAAYGVSGTAKPAAKAAGAKKAESASDDEPDTDGPEGEPVPEPSAFEVLAGACENAVGRVEPEALRMMAEYLMAAANEPATGAAEYKRQLADMVEAERLAKVPVVPTIRKGRKRA